MMPTPQLSPRPLNPGPRPINPDGDARRTQDRNNLYAPQGNIPGKAPLTLPTGTPAPAVPTPAPVPTVPQVPVPAAQKETNGQTTTTTPCDAQAPYLQDLFAFATQLFNEQGVPAQYPGQRVAEFSPGQLWAQNYQQAYAQGAAPQLGTNAQNTWARLLQSSDVNNNPHLQGAIDLAQGRTAENFNEQILPRIGSAAQDAGAYGGARHGIVEAQAVEGVQREMGDIATRMSNDAYQSGIQAELAALGISPVVSQMGLLPAQLMDQVGSQQQNQTQTLINDAIDRWNYTTNAPWEALARYGSAIQGNYGNTVSTPVSRTSPTLGAIGGAAAGLGLAGELEANNNITALLALLGAWGGGNG